MELGGGILFEDPDNVVDIDDLAVIDVDRHAGDGPAIVHFSVSGPAALRAFEDIGSFGNGTVDNCADGVNGTGRERGLGFGCLVNNHIIFEEDPGHGLAPFLRLASGPSVGVYGEFGSGPGRILITGPDHGYHASIISGEFQANHFCLLTNEIIWVSQVDLEDNLAKSAVDHCVDNASEYVAQQQQE